MKYNEMVKDSRKEKDDFFKHGHQSPLTEEQKEKFESLDYFPVKPELRFEAPLKLYEKPELIDIQTNTGRTQQYLRYGKFEFAVSGQKYFLTVYKAPDDDYYFVPFRDGTSAKETYGAGRYLELQPAKSEQFILDFNLAYNPYCAYNEHWSCPVPPRENWLKVRIEAGERSFPDSDH